MISFLTQFGEKPDDQRWTLMVQYLASLGKNRRRRYA